MTSILVVTIQRKDIKGWQWLLLLFGLTLTVDLAFGKLRLYAIHHFYHPLEMCLYTLFYSNYLDNKWIKKYPIWLMLLLVVGSVILTLIEGIQTYCTLPMILSHFVIAGFAILYFNNLHKTKFTSMRLIHEPIFWISIGSLVYYSGSFLELSMNKFIIDSDTELAHSLAMIGHVLNLVLFITYIVGFLCRRIFK